MTWGELTKDDLGLPWWSGGLTSPNAGGAGLISGQEVRSHRPYGQKPSMKQKQYCNRFNKDFKKVLTKRNMTQADPCR